MCELDIKCQGTGPYKYCIHITTDPLNATEETKTLNSVNNEEVECNSWIPTDKCDIPYTHFFQEAQPYTVILWIKNEVSQTKTPVGIQFIKGELTF